MRSTLTICYLDDAALRTTFIFIGELLTRRGRLALGTGEMRHDLPARTSARLAEGGG